MFDQTGIFTGADARRKGSLGCLSNQLHKDLELEAAEFTFYCKCQLEQKTGEVATPASARGFLIGVLLRTGLIDQAEPTAFEFARSTRKGHAAREIARECFARRDRERLQSVPQLLHPRVSRNHQSHIAPIAAGATDRTCAPSASQFGFVSF